MRLTQIIEALLFASDAPLSAADLLRVDERLDEDTVEAVIQELRAEYELSERSFQIYEVGGGYQLLTRPEFVAVLERYDSVPQPSRLSAPALEVLAIIAYRQPLGRAEIEDIRGVGSSGVLRTLQERSLIEPVARGEGLGRPLLYGTTRRFLEHFGFRSLEDLPRPDELPVVLLDRTPIVALPLDDDDTPAADAVAAPDATAAPAENTADATDTAAEADGAAEPDVPAEDDVGAMDDVVAEEDAVAAEEIVAEEDAVAEEDDTAADDAVAEPDAFAAPAGDADDVDTDDDDAVVAMDGVAFDGVDDDDVDGGTVELDEVSSQR